MKLVLCMKVGSGITNNGAFTFTYSHYWLLKQLFHPHSIQFGNMNLFMRHKVRSMKLLMKEFELFLVWEINVVDSSVNVFWIVNDTLAISDRYLFVMTFQVG